METEKFFKDNGELFKTGYFIACKLFIEIVECINFLHLQTPPIIHRDLNSDNILLKRDSTNGRFVKISDFGLIAFHSFENKKHTLDRGTIKIQAPEVIKSADYTTKADIYSMGRVFQELMNLDVIK
jgi:serine/threonine protein kinase